MRSHYLSIHKQYQEKSRALENLQEKYEHLDNKQKEQYAAYMAHQLETGEACPVCGSLEHPSKAVHQTELVNLTSFEELKQKLQKKQEAFLTFEKVYNDCKSDGRSQRDIVNNLQQDLAEEGKDLHSEADKDIDLITINKQRTTCQQVITDIERQQKETSLLLAKMKEQKTAKTNLLSQKDSFKQTFDQLNLNYQTTQNEALQTRTRLADLEKQLPAGIHDTEEFKQQLIKQEKVYEQKSLQWEEIKQAYQVSRSEEHTSELQSRGHLVCRLLLDRQNSTH